MSWLLPSPGHQQPRYWLCRIYGCLFSTWFNITKNFRLPNFHHFCIILCRLYMVYKTNWSTFTCPTDSFTCPRSSGKWDMLSPVSTWWCHQMETFSTSLALCVGNSPVTGEFPSQRPATRNFDVDLLRLNKCLSKQSWGWSSEMPLHSLWCHCNDEEEFQLYSPSYSFEMYSYFSWKWLST